MVNPVDAKARGIEDGSLVEVYNDRGHVVVKAVYNDGMRPGVVMYPKGWQKHQMVAGNWTEVLTAEYDPVVVNQSYFDNMVELRVWKEA